jgi:hypothetical protein
MRVGCSPSELLNSKWQVKEQMKQDTDHLCQ